ncbi:hypothetical protein VA7868_03243 [Vibrio aerogenes CECT 7868]|uniref:Uncharacterized protein n=1 Tax=Vibrio aerogenes CECT 7868 TaxID=1216006 RepID=A0A1M5ZV78_9VIBR|nr:YeeE/YedE family protein [Vibrio aerogenes]SHI27833.1 hypothetical protein VA7868_03243 [Vibrio aerogenes CECT 7868]
MWTHIPWFSLTGGMFIGLSALMLLFLNGKIAGISGILTGIFRPQHPDAGWRLLFALGLIAGGAGASYGLGFEMPDTLNISGIDLMTAGLLVGIGTRLANGCTSGHGICGVGRLSLRSIVATVTFMLVAAVTVYFRLHG